MRFFEFIVWTILLFCRVLLILLSTAGSPKGLLFHKVIYMYKEWKYPSPVNTSTKNEFKNYYCWLGKAILKWESQQLLPCIWWAHAASDGFNAIGVTGGTLAPYNKEQLTPLLFTLTFQCASKRKILHPVTDMCQSNCIHQCILTVCHCRK